MTKTQRISGSFEGKTTKAPHGGEAESPRAGDEVMRLVTRAQAGEPGAVSALLGVIRPRALAIALKVLRRPEDAEDAVQEAFVKVWRHIGRFEGRSSFTTWLHRIVMNSCLDLLRRQSCRPGVTSEEPGAARTELEESAAPAIESPEERLLACETAGIVRGALEVLSPVHRQAVTLREFEDYSYDEIATAAGCPVGTVMSRLHHARKRLAEELHDLAGSGDASLPCAA